ncbi:21355_t:CDS:2, partial [Racocetra persica]
MGNIFHNKNWKESEAELVKVTDRILNTLGEMWSNPVFSTHASCSEQSEGTYVTEVIIPLLCSSLGNLPNGCIALSTAERESLASKFRRNIGMNEMHEAKLWRETLDGASFIGLLCRPPSNQFGVVGIQVAGTVMKLNILVKDPAGRLRYFHLDQAEIPLSSHTLHTRSLVCLLLTLKNVIIVNKSLLEQALEKATLHPPRNPQLQS